MNATVYLFGEFNSGYSQYPDDYASGIFKTFYTHAKSTTQIAIHRDGNLMYYGYIRKLESDRYIGLCVVLNGLYLTKTDGLFSLYENVVANLITKGWLIHFNEQGEVVSNVEKLYVNKEEIGLITESLRAGFNRLETSMDKLPAVSYGKSKDSIEDFTIDGDGENIIKSSYQNGYTFIYKSKGFNTAQLDSYQGVLRRISTENADLKKEKLELQEKLQAVQRQKKQIRNVVLLVLVVIGCSIGIYSLNQNLNNAQWQLEDANETIDAKNMEIKGNNDEIRTLNDTLSSLRQSLGYFRQAYNDQCDLRQKVEEKFVDVCRFYPFVVSNCSVSKTAFSLDYYAINDKKVTVELKAVKEYDSEVVSGTYTLSVEKGGGSMNLLFDKQLDPSDYYYVVLMYDGHIIAGKRW